MSKQCGSGVNILQHTASKRSADHMGSRNPINHRQDVPARCNQFHLTSRLLVIAQGWFVEDHAFASHHDTHVGSAEIDGEIWATPESERRKVHHSVQIGAPNPKVSE